MIRRIQSRPKPRRKTLRDLMSRGVMTLVGAAGRTLGSSEPGQPPQFGGSIDNAYEDLGENGSIEASKAGFSQEGGKSSRTWVIQPADVSDLTSAIDLIIGDCTYGASGTGRLGRSLPQADPLYAWLYASSIPTIEGYGSYTKVSADPELEAGGFPYGTLWQYYRLHVESTQRPFPVLSDNSINRNSGSWYPETNGGTTELQFNYVDEQNRYCTARFVPQNDYITQQKGRQVFLSSDTGPDGANGNGSSAMPRIRLPNMLYEVTWYYVPLRYVVSSNSYLVQWLGRINQNEMTGPDGLVFNPGELLYLSFDPGTPFTPPVQSVVNLGGEGGSIISTEKFCNIKMTFLFTRRPISYAPTTSPTNLNYVVGGHNLQPWNDGPRWRYMQASKSDVGYASNYAPSWFSAPLEILWTDPDSPGGTSLPT